MSNDLSIKMTLDDSDFKQKINEAKQATEQFENEAKQASEQMKNMSDSTKQSGNFMREYQREIKSLKSQLLQLEEGTEEYTQAMQKLADKTFALRDINETARLSANDLGERFVLMTKTMSGLLSGFNAVQGALNLFGVESEEVNNALLKLSSVIAVIQGLEGLEGLTKTLPACANMFKQLTGTIKTCSVAMKALPYVAIASAIVGVVGYIVKQTKATKELTAEEKKAEEEAKRLKAIEETKNKVEENTTKTVGEMMGKYKLLQTQWKLLTDDFETKKKFIEDNASAFNDLGIQVDTVAQAEKILVDDTQNFCNAMKLRAQAIALQNQIVEESEKYFKDLNKKGVVYGTHRYVAKAGDKFTDLSNDEKAQITDVVNGNYVNNNKGYVEIKNEGLSSYSVITEAGANVLNAYRSKRMVEIAKEYKAKVDAEYNAKMNELTSQLQGVYNEQDKNPYGQLNPQSNIPKYIPSSTNNNGSGGNNDNTTDDNQPQQIDLTELLKQSILVNGGNLTAYNEEYTQKTGNELNSKNYWNDLTNNLQSIADSSGSEEFVKQIETIITKLPNYIAEAQTPEVNLIQVAEDAVNSGDFTKLDEYIKTSTQAKQGSVKFLEAKINALQDIESNTDDMELIGKVDTEVDKLRKELNELKKAIRAKTDPEGVVQEAQQTTLTNATKTASSIQSATSSISSMMSSIAKCTDDATASWLNYFANIIGTAGQLITTIQAIATANAINSASQIPLVGWLQIGAAAVSCIAAFSQLPKFADGGIVGGNNYNDGIHCMLSSGEMVLNKHQQGNLFKLLNNGTTPSSNNGGEVQFKISGTNLIGVLNNYNNKVNKVL